MVRKLTTILLIGAGLVMAACNTVHGLARILAPPLTAPRTRSTAGTANLAAVLSSDKEKPRQLKLTGLFPVRDR